MTKQSKTTQLKKPTDKPKAKFTKRVLDWSNYTALPFVAKAVVVVGFGYAVVNNLARFNQLPQTAQGATATLLIALTLKVATNKRGR